jgi:tripartite-type tricarboxylate transporter receptor subunit TctC
MAGFRSAFRAFIAGSGDSRLQRILCFLIAIAAAGALPAFAQQPVADFPVRPIRMVVPFTPGGSNDIVARLIGMKMAEGWGQQVVIDNRPGAGGALGAELVARAVPDGHTLILSNPGPSVHNILLRKKPLYGFDDFAPVIYVGYAPAIIIVNPKLPANNIREFVAYAKAHPGKISWGSPGTGSNPYIGMEMFKAAAKIDVTHVPYKGTGPAMTDLVAGQIDALQSSVASTEAYLKSGRVRVLAVAAAKRQAQIPEVSTLAEQGISGADIVIWYGLLTAARTPRAVIDKLNREVNRILLLPDVKARFDAMGAEIEGGTPEKFAAFIRSEAAALRRLIDSGAVSPE